MKFQKSPPDMYVDYRDRYPHEYTGLGICHLRALHNVHEAAAWEALQGKTTHTEPKKVHEIAKRHRAK